jgi:uncharacterized protein
VIAPINKILGTLLFALKLTVDGSIVRADPFADGVAGYERHDCATTLRLMQPLAVQGDARAQNNLGFMYQNGQGVLAACRVVAILWVKRH